MTRVNTFFKLFIKLSAKALVFCGMLMYNYGDNRTGVYYTMKTYSKRGIILLCSLVYFTSYFARKDFAAVTAGILQDGFLTKNIAGLIGTAMFAMYGIGQVISGILGDKFSPKVLILTGLGATCVCNAVMPFIPMPELMIPVWGLNGLAQAMLWPPIVHILSEHLNRDEYVKANLLVTSSAHIATIILYLYTPICLKFFNWKTVFLSAGALAAVIFAVFVIGLGIVLPSQTAKTAVAAKKSNAKTEGFATLLFRAGVFPIFGAIVAMGFLRDGIESWLPTLYAEAFNKDASEATLISVILPIFSILSIALVTSLHKRALKNETFGAAIMFVLALIFCVPLYFLIGTSSPAGRVSALILASLVCGCMHGCNFLYISCLPGKFAAHGHSAGTSGICNACTYVGAAISTYGIALIAEHMGWKQNIFVWGIIAAAGFVFALLSYRKYTRFSKEN